MRTLIVQTSFLGDVVLTTPLIASAARAGDVDVLCIPAAAPLLANNPAIRRVMTYDKRGTQRGIAGFARLAIALRREGYDRALLAQGSARSGGLMMAAGIGRRVGFDTSAGRRFYTERVTYIENEHHALRLLRLGGSNADSPPRPMLFPGAPERQAVDALVREGTQHLIGFAPGSVWATKRWPGYEQLASMLSHWKFVVIGSAADTEIARHIMAAAPGRVIDATGKLSLLASAELIRRCRVLVTNDSAPQHLASAMNTPTVAVFGPTVPAFGFGPLAERATTVGIDALACRPCDRHGPVSCPLRHWKCMRDVGVDTVIRAIEQVTDAAAL